MWNYMKKKLIEFWVFSNTKVIIDINFYLVEQPEKCQECISVFSFLGDG